MRGLLVTNYDSFFFFFNYDKVLTNCYRYYKLRRNYYKLRQNTPPSLAPVVSKSLVVVFL